MAEKRQRSKQRQAERRAQRLASRGGAGDGREQAARARDPEYQELEENVDLEVGAPPEEVGRSDFTTRHEEPPPPDFEIDDEELADEATSTAGAAGPRGVRGGRAARADAEHHHERGRVWAFLKSVWAELQRVQWPDRRTLMQLTGVVLFFVLIVGVYLGALDAIFSKLINSII